MFTERSRSPSSRLPDFVRWLLFLPGLLLAWLLLGLFMLVFPPNAPWWLPVDVAKASVAAMVLFPVVFALAPRGKAVVGWCFYLLMSMTTGLAVLVYVLEALAIVDLPWRPSAGMAFWERTEWRELGKAVAWLVLGTASFRYCLGKHRAGEKEAAPPMRRGVPEEVLACRREFDTIKAELLERPTPQYLGLPDEVFAAVQRLIDDTGATIHTVRVEKVPPRLLVWLVFSNVTGEALATGRFHIYRNVLSMSGKALLVLFLRSIDELDKGGHYTGREQTAEQDRLWIRKRIAEAG